MKWIIIIIYSLLSNGGLIAISYGAKKGTMINLSKGYFDIGLSFYSILGFLMYVFSFLIYIVLISKYNLSYIIPLTTAISYIIIFIASAFFLKEPLTVLHIAGYFIIILGVILINIK